MKLIFYTSYSIYNKFKGHILFLYLLLIFPVCFAQQKKKVYKKPIAKKTISKTGIKKPNASTIAKKATTTNPIFRNPEVEAEYIGGEDKLIQYLQQNIYYPKSASDNEIQGIVKVEFQVCQDGTLCDARILKSVSPDIDKEALRVVKKMGKWKPALLGGKPVNSFFVLPINFYLEESK